MGFNEENISAAELTTILMQTQGCMNIYFENIDTAFAVVYVFAGYEVVTNSEAVW
jgi:hypothetical protein